MKPTFIFLFLLLIFNVSALSARVKKIDIGLLDNRTSVIKYTVSGFVEDVTEYRTVMTITKGKNKRIINAEGWTAC